jgi:hypothetical protein
MKMFLHILNTWLASILMALLVSFIYAQFLYGPADFIGWFSPASCLVLFYCMLSATPSFLISWALLALIKQASYSNFEKLFLWLLAAIVSISLNIFILLLLFAGEIISLDIFFIFWPAYAAVVITIILRLKQFFLLVNKTTPHETNLV